MMEAPIERHWGVRLRSERPEVAGLLLQEPRMQLPAKERLEPRSRYGTLRDRNRNGTFALPWRWSTCIWRLRAEALTVFFAVQPDQVEGARRCGGIASPTTLAFSTPRVNSPPSSFPALHVPLKERAQAFPEVTGGEECIGGVQETQA